MFWLNVFFIAYLIFHLFFRLPQKVGQLINSACKGDWLAETRSYYILKTNIFHELMSLCSRFYK